MKIYSLTEDYSIRYSTSDKRWGLHNGELLATFPAGEDGKRAAALAGLSVVDADLFELARRAGERHPSLASRALNAALLVHFGHVRESRDLTRFTLGEVLSQSAEPLPNRPRILSVFNQRQRLRCGCRDFRDGGVMLAGRAFCKHIVAYCMADELGRLDWIEWQQQVSGTARHRSGSFELREYVSPSPFVFRV